MGAPAMRKTWAPDRAAAGSLDPAVLRCLAEHGPATAEAIARRTGHRYSAVKSALRRLDGSMVVRQAEVPRERGRGRKARLWRRVAPGEWCRPGEFAGDPPGLAPLMNQSRAMEAFVGACRDLLAAAEREHADALAAVRRWAAANTDPIPAEGGHR